VTQAKLSSANDGGKVECTALLVKDGTVVDKFKIKNETDTEN
jgi:hypothetical protein